MATVEQLERALRNADAAGDVEAARKLAAALRAANAGAASAAQEPDSKPSDLESFGRGAADMVAFGFDDEITSGVRTGFGLWGDYGKDVEGARQRKATAQQENPWAYGAGQLAGAVPSAFVPLGAAARGVGLAAKVGRGVATGAAMGGLYGAGSGEGSDRLRTAGIGAVAGGIGGAAIPAAGHLIGKGVGRVVGSKLGAPTVEALRKQANDLYGQSEKLGVMVRGDAVDRLARRVNAAVQLARGYDPDMLPNTAIALRKLKEAGGTPASLSRLDELRQIANTARQSLNNPNERRLGGVIIKEIDDFLDNLSPMDVNAAAARSAGEAVDLVKRARGLWRRQSKGRVIEDAIYNARNAASGFENGLRTEFRKLLKVRDGGSKYGWTKDERKAIEAVVRGGGPAMGNLWRILGFAGIPVDGGRNGLGAFLSGTAGTAGGGLAGGPLGALGGPALVAAGTGARLASQAATRSSAERAGAIVRAGGIRPMSAPARSIGESAATGILGVGRQGVGVPLALEYLPR